jgi:type II secretion system protein G
MKDHETSRELGFTLIELMVVVAIIALLAAIIIPNYVHARAQASVSQTEANIKQIATALELYYGDNEAYPASGDISPTLFGGATNPYLTTTPTNALGHRAYAYTNVAVAGKPDSYTVVDSGPYDSTTLSSLTKGAGTGTPCGTAGCSQIVYDPQDGFYGQ